MYIRSIHIENFRCIKSADINISEQNVLVGDNNCGKSTLLDAIDLVMGPDRMSRHPVVNEYDFYCGKYIGDPSPEIKIEVTLCDLNDEEKRYFIHHLEWFDIETNKICDQIEPLSNGNAIPIVRVCFSGRFNPEEDDFEGETYYLNPISDDSRISFTKKDKRLCGFLYLRTLRTGSRALSLEHGSLLEIILSLKEVRPQMWEGVIGKLNDINAVPDGDAGLSDILLSLNNEIHKFLPEESVNNPVMRVSDMTRESLRKVITVFLESENKLDDGTHYSVPYYKMGTGTINVLVLALLSIIASLKQNVIFAMDEPEIAIPPYIQKSIVTNVFRNSKQSIFTSHSPYVLEEFKPDNVLILSNTSGVIRAIQAKLPPNVKMKAYREELRKNYFESLLSKKVLITEGRTEYDVYSTAARKLEELNPDKYSSFERMGISLVNAESDSKVAPLGKYYKSLDKSVYAVCDEQEPDAHTQIKDSVDLLFEAPEHGIEDLVLNGISTDKIKEYILGIVEEGQWPKHMEKNTPTLDTTNEEFKKLAREYFKQKKGNGALADLISICEEDDMPEFITNVISKLKTHCSPSREETDFGAE